MSVRRPGRWGMGVRLRIRSCADVVVENVGFVVRIADGEEGADGVWFGALDRAGQVLVAGMGIRAEDRNPFLGWNWEGVATSSEDPDLLDEG
jgi:hypothetical protein